MTTLKHIYIYIYKNIYLLNQLDKSILVKKKKLAKQIEEVMGI